MLTRCGLLQADYEVQGLLDTDFKFSLFRQRAPASQSATFNLFGLRKTVTSTRRRMLEGASFTFPMVACHGVC